MQFIKLVQIIIICKYYLYLILYNSFVQLCAKNCISSLSSSHTALWRLPSALASVYIYMCVYKLYIICISGWRSCDPLAVVFFFNCQYIDKLTAGQTEFKVESWGKTATNTSGKIPYIHTHILYIIFVYRKPINILKQAAIKTPPWQWPNGINWLFIIYKIKYIFLIYLLLLHKQQRANVTIVWHLK